MGEDEWTHREPGSAAGSVFPPPAVQKESPPIQPLNLAQSPAAEPPPLGLPNKVRYGVLPHNSRIKVSASAQPDLVAGLLDPRLLMMLASQHPKRILGFNDRVPRSAQGVPLTGAELADYDTAAGLSADGYFGWLLVFLRGQRVPYWPASVATTRVGGHEIVRVRFSRPSPIGFLNG